MSVYRIFFIHSSVDRLRSLPFLAAVNNADMKCRHLFGIVISSPLDKYLKVGLWGDMVGLLPVEVEFLQGHKIKHFQGPTKEDEVWW